MKYKLAIMADDGFCFPVVESDTPFLDFSNGEFIYTRHLQPHPVVVCDRYKIIEVTHHIVQQDGVLFSHTVEARVEAAEAEGEGDGGDALNVE
jgi:hypothetical protein